MNTRFGRSSNLGKKCEKDTTGASYSCTLFKNKKYSAGASIFVLMPGNVSFHFVIQMVTFWPNTLVKVQPSLLVSSVAIIPLIKVWSVPCKQWNCYDEHTHGKEMTLVPIHVSTTFIGSVFTSIALQISLT
jgi:hypothetical protein